MTDDFAELLEGARVALYDVIKELEPGTGLVLHNAYSSIKHALAAENKPETVKTDRGGREEREERWRRQRERRERWTKLSKPERDRLTLELLGEDELTVRHVMDRLRGEFGDDAVRITDAPRRAGASS